MVRNLDVAAFVRERVRRVGVGWELASPRDGLLGRSTLMCRRLEASAARLRTSSNVACREPLEHSPVWCTPLAGRSWHWDRDHRNVGCEG